MVAPFLIDTEDSVAALSVHAPHPHAAMASTASTNAIAVGLHTLSYVVVSTLIAWIVYRKVCVAFLRVAWFNLDWVWAGALVITGVLVVLS